MPYTAPVYSFIETKLFTRLSSELLSDDQMLELQAYRRMFFARSARR
jgi:hypothetical protein